MRWNSERAIKAIDCPDNKLRSFDQKLRLKVKSVGSTVLQESSDPFYPPPAVYTGERFGIEYLYSEVGSNAPSLGTNIDLEIEEGLDDDDDLAAGPDDDFNLDPEMNIAVTSFKADCEETQPDTGLHQLIDFKSIEGWDKVAALVASLLEIKNSSISTHDAEKIVRCYEELSQYDKKPISYGRTIKSPRGRFGRSKNEGGHVGMDAMKRCFVSAGSPSMPPSKSRVVEVICVNLCNTITSPQTSPNYISRYAKILQRYNQIKYAVSQNPIIMENTGLTLFQINETTLAKW